LNELSCPVCKAENTTGPACRRCKADLGLLWQLAAQRSGILASAQAALAAGRTDEALELVQEAGWLRTDADVARLEALVRLVRGDFPAAWDAYCAAVDG
jgi:hypothetical protein